MPPAHPYISILRYRNQTIFCFWPNLFTVVCKCSKRLKGMWHLRLLHDEKCLLLD